MKRTTEVRFTVTTNVDQYVELVNSLPSRRFNAKVDYRTRKSNALRDELRSRPIEERRKLQDLYNEARKCVAFLIGVFAP